MSPKKRLLSTYGVLFGTCLGLGWGLGLFYFAVTPRSYLAQTRLLVSDTPASGAFFNYRVTSGYEAILRYTRVLQSILESDPTFFKAFEKKANLYPTGEAYLKNHLVSRSVPGSLLLEITLAADNETTAIRYLKAVMEALAETLAAQNAAVVAGLEPKLSREIAMLKEELGKASEPTKRRSAEEAIALLELKRRELDVQHRNFAPPYSVFLAPKAADVPTWPRPDVILGLATLLGLLFFVIALQWLEFHPQHFKWMK